MNLGFLIDNRKCIGCHACTVACKAEHDLPIGVNRTWVKYVEKGRFPNTRRMFSVLRCNHCAAAPCVEICPTSALHHLDNGVVDFDTERCIACKSCMQACPYDALYIDPEDHVAEKCNFCAHRLERGLEPACVVVCPEEAIVFGDLEDAESEISQLVAREPVSVRKPEKGTLPRLYYIEGDRASLSPAAAEASDQYMWSEQYRGVGHFARYAEKRGSEKDPGELLVQLALEAGTDAKHGREIAEALQSDDPRRVYDSPGKGVLWGWEVSAYVWTKAMASGLFLVSILAGWLGWLDEQVHSRAGTLLTSLVLLAVTAGLLVKDLDQPRRFLYVLLRPQWKSWLVKGACVLTGFGGVLALLLAQTLVGARPASWLEGAGVALALLAAVYTAFLFAQAKGRDFWQSPVAPVQMGVHALIAGTMVLALLMRTLPSELALTATVLLGINLLLFAAELATPHATRDAAAAAGMIVRGRYALSFWGTMLFTRVLPLAALWRGAEVPLELVAVVVLLGILSTEHIWVRAPQLVPLS